MHVSYDFEPVLRLIEQNPEDPPYTALFYDPVDIAIQKPNNEKYDERHEKIRNFLFSKNIRQARQLFLSNEITLLNRANGILIDSALTVELGPMVNSERTGQDQLDDIFREFEAIKQADGCLLVVKNSSPDDHPAYYAATWGGIMSNSTCQLGCNGVITDGFVRDQYQLESIGEDFNYLVFGKGNCALDARGHLQINSYLQPITMKGLNLRNDEKNEVTIHPGDLVIADKDGIIVIPHEIAGEVIELSIERYDAEKYIVHGIRSQEKENVIPFIKKHGIL